ncbi:hypothetical protein BH09VER1_BH09VER1_55420 [soil metagenome]
MKRFKVSAGYRQFYVADSGLEPLAPEDWTDAHLAQRHNTLKHITALCPEGDITARIVSCGPDDIYSEMPDPAEFEVETEIEIASGKIGVYGWPWELKAEYTGTPGIYIIRFRGYALSKVDCEEDYYGLEIRKKP